MPPAEDEFDDDEFDDLDEIAIQELDALESELNGVKPSALPSASTGLHQRAANPKATPPRLIPTPVGHSRLQNGANASVLPGIEATSEDLFDDSWDEVMLNDIDQLDSMYNDARTAEPAPPRNRTFRRSTSGSFKQRNLFGDIIPDGPERRAPAQSPGSLSLSSQNQSGASSGARRHSTKQWDRTAYAKSGHRSMKGKERARHASTRDEYGAAIGSEEEAEAEDAGEPEGEVNM